MSRGEVQPAAVVTVEGNENVGTGIARAGLGNVKRKFNARSPGLEPRVTALIGGEVQAARKRQIAIVRAVSSRFAMPSFPIPAAGTLSDSAVHQNAPYSAPARSFASLTGAGSARSHAGSQGQQRSASGN